MPTLRDSQILRRLYYLYKVFISHFSYTYGKNNHIHNHGISVLSKIQVSGSNNKILVERGVVLMKARMLIVGDNNSITIRKGAYLEKTDLHIEDNNCKVCIGSKTFIGPSHLAITEDGSELHIGEDCMISSNVSIRTGDSHAIFDCDGNRINQARSIVLGDMVWLGEGSKILKGVSVSKNTIVSSGSIVTKSFGPNILLGGIPARILKENVTWTHSRK